MDQPVHLRSLISALKSAYRLCRFTRWSICVFAVHFIDPDLHDAATSKAASKSRILSLETIAICFTLPILLIAHFRISLPLQWKSFLTLGLKPWISYNMCSFILLVTVVSKCPNAFDYFYFSWDQWAHSIILENWAPLKSLIGTQLCNLYLFLCHSYILDNKRSNEIHWL